MRVVRTTAAVAIELLLPDEEAGLSGLALWSATATPPATTPPTKAPAIAAMATTRLAETSAIATRRHDAGTPLSYRSRAGERRWERRWDRRWKR